MACFEQNLYTRSLMEITPMNTTFFCRLTSARDIQCDITQNNCIATCTYPDIEMHSDIAMGLFYYLLLCSIMILLFPSKLFKIVHKTLKPISDPL